MDYEDVVRRAIEKGWVVKNTGGGHRELKSPDGDGRVIASATPGDHRAAMNLVSDFKRNGLDVHAGLDKKHDKSLSRRLMIDFMRRHSERSINISEILAVVRASGLPEYTEPAMFKLVQAAANRGDIHRTDRGWYRWGPLPIVPGTIKVASPTTEHVPAATVITAAQHADAETDEDMLAIDEALVALSKIEMVVRRNREKLKQLAVLKKLLGEIQ